MLVELKWEVLVSLAPFRLIQHALQDTRFSNVKEVQKFVDEWIDSKNKYFYRRGFHLLPERWTKVVENRGKYSYFDQCNNFFLRFSSNKCAFSQKSSSKLIHTPDTS